MACACELGLSLEVLEVGPCQQKGGSQGEWKRDLPSRATNISSGTGNNINDLLVVSAITLTGSLSADSKGDELSFVSCSTSSGIAAISLVETVDMDGASNWVEFDSLVRNSRQCLQIAENNKIRAINRQNYARSKTRIQVNALKKNRLTRSNWNKHGSDSIK